MTRLKASSAWPGHVLSDLACQYLFSSQACTDITLPAERLHTSRQGVGLFLGSASQKPVCPCAQIGMCANNVV